MILKQDTDGELTVVLSEEDLFKLKEQGYLKRHLVNMGGECHFIMDVMSTEEYDRIQELHANSCK